MTGTGVRPRTAVGPADVIDFNLIESQFRHLMRVAVSVREGSISSSTPLKRLRSGSKKNATYAAFHEVGRVIHTVQPLRCLSDAPLHRRVTAATNKVESFNRFSQRIGVGNHGVIADNDPVEQEPRPGGCPMPPTELLLRLGVVIRDRGEPTRPYPPVRRGPIPRSAAPARAAPACPARC